MAMFGDQYQAFYHLDGHTVQHGETTNNWKRAVELRDEAFEQNPRVRSAWIMRTNPSTDLRPDKRGYSLQRSKHEIASACS